MKEINYLKQVNLSNIKILLLFLIKLVYYVFIQNLNKYGIKYNNI